MPYVPYVPCVLWPMSAGLAAYSLCAVCTVVVGGSCAFSVCRVCRDGGRWAGRECRGEVGVLPMILHWRAGCVARGSVMMA